MILKWLELHDFRNYRDLVFTPRSDGVVVVIGDNGQGKTSLLEAISFLATRRSFRGASKEAVISYGSNEAVIRGGFESSQHRELLVEASLARTGRDRFLLNKQPLQRVSEISKTIPITVFAAQEIEIIRGAPTLRRDFLDGCVSMLFPRGESVIASVEKVLRQRGMLLKQSGGVISSEISSTLDVWDQQLGTYGNRLVEMREELVELLGPYASEAYGAISGHYETVALTYKRSWNGDLHQALLETRKEDIRRQTNGIGPHRDELEIDINGHSFRHNGSQGEQRTAAYALKVAFHTLFRNRMGEDPILLLDDVFSELDSARSEAIMNSVSATQTILTTTGNIPDVTDKAMKILVEGGQLFDTLSQGEKSSNQDDLK